ncbi:MAG: site-specific DNA-methyltransferase [Candidatus Moraniibacteriota bacterium]
MPTINFKEKLEKLLKKEKIFLDESNEIDYIKVKDSADKIDAKLIEILISDKEAKKKFFIKIKDIFVFNINDFKFFLEENKVNNSYTQYKNRIGLTDGKKFLKDTNDVVLDFPFKDCVLEGGQSTEEGTDTYFEYSDKTGKYEEKTGKRNEIFFNSVLAHDEIDRLFDPKALVCWKRYTKKGKQSVKEIKRDEDGIIRENLIIKGNNLLVLQSLKKKFAGKVKLIYIDPPYNTGNDGFKYNDNFNHSTWLTFMKNRLEVARELLSNSGSIFISIDDREFAYLKILCDEIFGEENFLNDIIWNSTKSVTNTAIISVSHTHNLVYFKDKDYYIKNRTEFRLAENGEGFSNPDNDPRGVWKADPFQVGGWRPNQQYEIKNPNTGVIYKPNENCSWKNDFNKFQELLEDNRIVFGVDGKVGPQRKRFLFEAEERGKVAKTIWDDVGTTTNGTQHLNSLLKRNLFTNPKPESFLQKVLELGTQENDIVLDFFGGSGTTGAVAHKMNRQYVLIEQMDYIHDLPEARLIKVIQGEQGGISKSVNWQGGGEFIYCELARWNETAKEKILACESLEELIKFFNEMSKKYFLNYNLIIKEFTEKVIKEKEFKNLSLEEQKKMFIAMLDNNQMYINESEMEDGKFGIDKEDVVLTKEFYNNK